MKYRARADPVDDLRRAHRQDAGALGPRHKIRPNRRKGREVVNSGAFKNFFPCNHIINIYKKFFFRRSKRQRNFPPFFLLHKRAKPAPPPCPLPPPTHPPIPPPPPLCDAVGGAFYYLVLRERVCCLLVLNLVSCTLPCIRQPGPRLRVLGVCDFV